MSTTIMNFKSGMITAATKEEAIKEIEAQYFHICGDATQALKNAKAKHTGVWTERDEKAWKLDYCNKKNRSLPGSGFLVTIESPVISSKERPYKIERVKNEGKRKEKKTYTWVDSVTGAPITKVRTNLTDAENAIKEVYKKGDLKNDAECIISKEYIQGNPVVAKAKYSPSKNTKPGTWMYFGIENC